MTGAEARERRHSSGEITSDLHAQHITSDTFGTSQGCSRDTTASNDRVHNLPNMAFWAFWTFPGLVPDRDDRPIPGFYRQKRQFYVIGLHSHRSSPSGPRPPSHLQRA